MPLIFNSSLNTPLKLIYEYNSHEKLEPASMTKMMSLLLIMEAIEDGKIKWDDVITVSKNAADMGGSQIYLETGEEMTVRDLIKGITMASANDATVAMAEKIAGSEEKFVEISKLLMDVGYKKSEAERAIKNFVRYVKSRSGKGKITWDEFIAKLKELELEDSDFGIRIQRFSKYSYWEVWFNHFDVVDHEEGKSTVTFNQEYYEETVYCT